jgi:hypothetical protein
VQARGPQFNSQPASNKRPYRDTMPPRIPPMAVIVRTVSLSAVTYMVGLACAPPLVRSVRAEPILTRGFTHPDFADAADALLRLSLRGHPSRCPWPGPRIGEPRPHRLRSAHARMRVKWARELRCSVAG